MKTITQDLYDALRDGTRTSVEGYVEGAHAGTFEPCRDERGNIGWQAVSDGLLLGWLDSSGKFGSPFDRGNTTWELCEVTPAHLQALRLASQPWLTCPFEWR